MSFWKRKLSSIRRFFKILGPGIITGAADDDPSGITTYSQTGAQFGFAQTWTALYQMPLLIAVQEACARIGAVTGKGLAQIIKQNYSRKVLYAMVGLVVVANTINIGADIGAIASAANLVFEFSFSFYAVLAVGIILFLEVFVTYKRYAKFLKWLALSLLAYPITAFIVEHEWLAIFQSTLVPHIQFSFDYLFIVVGVFGTTISPYMFFWQASEEVEEEKIRRATGIERFLWDMRVDTFVGMIAANVAQWFVIVVAATVLFSNGVTNIETAADAARALEPLVSSFPNAGFLAKIIFSAGIIGLGFLAIPVLAGSAAYALSEAMGWQEGLGRKLGQAKGFYGIIIIATLIGLGMNFIGINPMKALVFTAVFNGVAAVPLLYLIARINRNEKILGRHRGGRVSSLLIWCAFAIMAFAAIGMFSALIFE